MLGTVQVFPVQVRVVVPTFQTYDAGVPAQVAVSNGDAEPFTTDGFAGVMLEHANVGSALTSTSTLAAALVPLALVPVTV